MNQSLDRSPSAPSTTPARAPTHSFAAPYTYLPTEHGKVALYRFGRGPDVVFVHG
jgi:hypothetical protein